MDVSPEVVSSIEHPDMCEELDSDALLAQGDIFVSTEDSPRRRIGIIVTGDCDIARDKAWRFLTWVPLVPAPSYVASRWAYDELKKLKGTASNELVQGIHRHRAAASLPALSAEALAAWLPSASRESIGEAFGCDPSSTEHAELQRQFGDQLEAAKRSTRVLADCPPRNECWNDAEIAAVIDAVQELKTATSGKKREDLVARVSQVISGHPGDVFPIYGLQDRPADGHVALLRFVREVGQDDVATQAGAAVQRDLPFYRVARLRSPYRYDLTRRLGAVFSDIGLPDDYGTHKQGSAKRIAEGLVPRR